MSEQNQDGKATDNGDQNQNTKAQDNGNGDDKTAHMIPKTRFDQVVNQRNELEATLKSLADEVKGEVPEDFQDLIPGKLSPQDQILWIRNAQKKGLFGGQQQSSGPDSKRPMSKQAENFDGMTASEKIKSGLTKFKK